MPSNAAHAYWRGTKRGCNVRKCQPTLSKVNVRSICLLAIVWSTVTSRRVSLQEMTWGFFILFSSSFKGLQKSITQPQHATYSQEKGSAVTAKNCKRINTCNEAGLVRLRFCLFLIEQPSIRPEPWILSEGSVEKSTQDREPGFLEAQITMQLEMYFCRETSNEKSHFLNPFTWTTRRIQWIRSKPKPVAKNASNARIQVSRQCSSAYRTTFQERVIYYTIRRASMDCNADLREGLISLGPKQMPVTNYKEPHSPSSTYFWSSQY